MVESTTQSNSTSKKDNPALAEDEEMLIESSEKIELV